MNTNDDGPVNVNEILNRGYAALSQNALHEAAYMVKIALQEDDTLVPAHFLAGLIAAHSQQFDAAISAFETVIESDNNHVAAWSNLAWFYMIMGMANKSDNAIQQLIRLDCYNINILQRMGKVLSLMGRHRQANTYFSRAYTLEPENLTLMQNLANNLIQNGDLLEAQLLLRKIIDRNPLSSEVHWLLSGSAKARDTKHIEEIKALFVEGGFGPSDSAFYHYAIGKEYEDLEQWPEAFDAFSKGAKAKRTITAYSEQNEIESFEFLKRHFTQNWMNDGNPSCSAASPIFVLGQPRTGTTLIEQIIGAHTDVYAAGELQQLMLAIYRLAGGNSAFGYSMQLYDAALNVSPEEVGNLYLKMLGKMRGNTAKFVDKLPVNYLLLPFILKAFPNAKVVHLVRDPMDTCFAGFKQLFAATYLHSYDQEEMARHHLRYLDLMDVWRERFGDRFLDIGYEDTVKDLEPNARKLMDFLELPWQDACLNFHSQATSVATASAVQVREPVHTRSIGRWRRYEQQLEPMLTILKEGGASLEG